MSVACQSAQQTDSPCRQAGVRVLHIINGEDYSGAERVQDQLALRLPELGYDVSFACVLPGMFATARQAQDAPLFEAPMRSRFDLRPARKLASLIRRERFALVHSHSARAALVGRPAAALAGVPLVHHMHMQTASEVQRLWFARFQAVVERATLVGTSGIVAVSESLRCHLRRWGYPAGKVWLVPNGVPCCGELPPLRRATDGWTVGTVAMFRPRKGVEILLSAIALLRRQRCPVRLRAVGRFQSPDYEQEVRQLAARLGLEQAVDWVGFQRDIQAELAHMDCFVLPSLIAEAMPMSVLEAMAAGVPVIGTRVDGITDLVQDGVTGLLAAPGDAEDLAHVLKRIINREIDVQTLRVAAHCKQVERYSDRSMAAAIAAIYDAILEPSMSRNPSHTLTNPVGSHTPCAVRTAPCGFDNPAADGARTMTAPLQEAVP